MAAVTAPSPPTDITPTSSSFNRIAATSGLVMVGGIIFSLIAVGEMPAADDDAAAIVDYFTENSGAHQAGLVAVVLTVIPGFLFLAGLLGPFRRSDREHGEGWSFAILASMVFADVFASIGVMIDSGLLLSRDVLPDEGTLLAVWDINIASAAMLSMGIAGVGLCVGVPVLLHGIRPAWYGWLSLLLAALGLLAIVPAISAGAGILGLPMFLGFFAWVIATSVLLYKDA